MTPVGVGVPPAPTPAGNSCTVLPSDPTIETVCLPTEITTWSCSAVFFVSRSRRIQAALCAAAPSLTAEGSAWRAGVITITQAPDTLTGTTTVGSPRKFFAESRATGLLRSSPYSGASALIVYVSSAVFGIFAS